MAATSKAIISPRPAPTAGQATAQLAIITTPKIRNGQGARICPTLDLLMNMTADCSEQSSCARLRLVILVQVASQAPAYHHADGRADLRCVLCDSKTQAATNAK